MSHDELVRLQEIEAECLRNSWALKTCAHDWLRRGHARDKWRECFLCGEIVDGWDAA